MSETFEITAGSKAFGDGSHPTTAGVMTALEAIDPALFSPRAACDMGCGSGLLSLAIVAKFACPVVAVDVERSAVEATRANAARNECTQVHAIHSDGFGHREIASRAPYDLIVMNILAEPLLRLAADAGANLAHGGALILSGIMRWQEEQIKQAYQSLGLELTSRITLGDWVTLVWQKP